MNDTNTLVHLTLDEGIAQIRFASPATLNAIGVPMARALLHRVKEALADKRTRVIVLSGEGRAFMAGGDLQAFHADPAHAPDTARNIIDPLHEAVTRLADAAPPVIASVHGAVAGAGLSLLMGSDLAIAADNCRFVPAYAKIGTSPDGGGSWALARLVGLRKALEIALLSEPFDAATALSLGIVNKVVPAAELAEATQGLAQQLAVGPTQAYGETKRLMRASTRQSLAEQLAQEREAFARCAGTHDFAEGISAFFEKRPAKYSGT